ncbi:2-methylcitrate dehydratase PrpD [Neorhizobium huautlense]|uniref:2-methylcitrate dehydratase PrpD n=1 Tax=Neorhizobium huautlense TaxID=67774 RepID=A0ABT9PZ60_9HYPH|nr:2-methylcitrate dehydratase PrpD [Neorhizobium huautlense]
MPEAARQAAFKCIMDLLGAALAGVNEKAVVATRRMAVSMMGQGSVPVWFSDAKTTPAGAAWANSAAASILDIDDGNRLARGHPGAAIIPTAFAIGQETGASLERIIAAIVIGYEVGVTIAAARLVYGNTGTWSSYAVVATAAALRGTGADVVEHALAIAGESAPNQLFASAASQVPPPEGSDVKEGIPWSVVTGLMALGLAEGGHTGPRNILDSVNHYRFAEDLNFGGELHICRTYLKLYACCRHVHAPLDALLATMGAHGIKGADIDAIEVDAYAGALRISNKVDPENLTDIQYSIPYCLGLVALAGREMLLPLTVEALGRDDVRKLAAKVTLRQCEEFNASFPAQTLAKVAIIANGQRFVSGVTAPKGEASDPLTWQETRAKFKDVSRWVATEVTSDALLDAIEKMRDGSMDELTSQLSGLDLTSVNDAGRAAGSKGVLR